MAFLSTYWSPLKEMPLIFGAMLIFFLTMGPPLIGSHESTDVNQAESEDKRDQSENTGIFLLNAPIAQIHLQVGTSLKMECEFEDILATQVKIFSHFVTYVISYYHTLFVFIISCMAP